ncbi:MFS transporter [Undibacterium sp. TJN19]|uniref:MFS transporter n=1 Tax=Undibacterium sp. TJN19 TaxID=3413055 RepID=UPI003BF27E7D
MLRFPSTVIRLLLSSFVFVLGRAVALPFMALYLSEKLGLGQQAIGWILGGSIFFATLFGLYAGYLADRIDKRRLMMIACMVVAVCSALVSVSAHALAALLALTCIEAALTLRGISLKAMLADLLPAAERPRAFSMNYMLINMAFSIGPLIGASAFAYSVAAPLWIAAMFSLLASQVVGYQKSTPVHAATESAPAKAGFKTTLIDLKNDRRLILFTLGSVLTSFVFGRFVSGYLSLYLILTQGVQETARLVPYILMTNAIGVVVLQYPIGKFIHQKHLFRWVTLGASLYIVGLLGFMHAASVLAWVLATVAFTLGEVIVIPSEYMFIDMIAPADKRGSYFGAQSLSTFGAAFNPIICGFLLAHFSGAVMFWVLIASASLGVLLYYAGTHVKSVVTNLSGKTEKETAITAKPVSATKTAMHAASQELATNRVKTLFPLN